MGFIGVILWFLKAFLHVAKPFAKIALVESLLDAINNVVNDTASQTDAVEDEG